MVDDGLGLNPVTYYVHSDHLNRPIAMSDASKALVAQWIWEPYGGLFSYSGSKDLDCHSTIGLMAFLPKISPLD